MRDIPTCPGEFRALAALFRFTLRRRHLWSSETLLPSFSRPLSLSPPLTTSPWSRQSIAQPTFAADGILSPPLYFMGGASEFRRRVLLSLLTPYVLWKRNCGSYLPCIEWNQHVRYPFCTERDWKMISIWSHPPHSHFTHARPQCPLGFWSFRLIQIREQTDEK